MTFVVKELSVLRSHFDDTVDIILKRERKGKIEELSNPRKYELFFLSSILAKLEEQIRLKPQKSQSASTANYSLIFYGAMLVVMKDIDLNRGMMDSPGLLNSRLADAIGISDGVKAEDKPDFFQISKFYTAFNAFINNQIFVDNDSRKGFDKGHVLLAVPIDQLHQLVKISYKLEQSAQKAIIASFLPDGKTMPNVAEYMEARKTPASATERFGSLAKLNSDLDNLIKDELANKNVPKIEKLSQHRAAQLHFLNVIRESLKASKVDEMEKVAILAGAMHLVRQQIMDEYKSSYVSSSDNSIIHKGLSKLLGADEVSPQDMEALVTSSIHFVRFMTIEPKKADKKAICAANIFSPIPGFDLKATLNLFIDMINSCRTEAVERIVENFKKEGKASEKAQAGYLSGFSALTLSLFGGGKKSGSAEEEEDEDELEHKCVTSVSTGTNTVTP